MKLTNKYSNWYMMTKMSSNSFKIFQFFVILLYYTLNFILYIYTFKVINYISHIFMIIKHQTYFTKL